MGLGPSYFANFTSARNGCIEHGLRDRWGVRSEWLGGYHSKTMGLGSSYFANFYERTEWMHRTRLARWRYPFSPATKCEYSNNTLEPSACISGQGGKSEDLYGKGHEFKPALGISF